MRVVWVAALLVMVTLAGCSEEAMVPDEAPEEQKFETLETKASKTTGVIRGIVIDQTITPIADVTVKIASTGATTTTNQDGAFAFQDLEPGSYFLLFSKPGFGKIQQASQVEAGVDKPAIMKVQLFPDPSSLPYVQGFLFNGYIACSWTLPVVALAMCSVPELVGVDLGDEFITFMDTDGVPTFTQGEQVWESTQSLGESLSFSIFDGDTTAPSGGSQRGVSPLILSHDYEYWNVTEPRRMVAYEEQIAYRTFAAGYPGTECLPTGNCFWGVGVVLEQKFDVFTHIFYNSRPAEGWLFILDGAPDV